MTDDLNHDATLAAGTPTGVDSSDVQGRSELAQALGKDIWPANALALIAKAEESRAADRVVTQLRGLPIDHEFINAQEVWDALGGGREQRT